MEVQAPGATDHDGKGTPMKSKMAFLTGAAVGYVLGSRAGRARYEEIRTKARTMFADERVQEVVETAKEKASEAAEAASAAVRAKVGEVASDAGTALKDRVTSAFHHDDEPSTPPAAATPPTSTVPPAQSAPPHTP